MTSLTGKTILITGVTSGIGLEASVALARAGGNVVLVARNAAKGEPALADVRARSGSGSVSLMLCDFASQAEIRALAAAFIEKHDRLDILINNAGAVNERRKTTVDGLEETFAVNHLGYVLLTNLLLPLIKRSAPSRIVLVASTGHYQGTLAFENLQFEHGGYSIMNAYRRSKLGNVLFGNELARRLAGSGVTVNSLHPGLIASNIWARAPKWAQPLLNLGKKLLMDTPETGGDRIVYLACSDEVAGKTGGYYEKNRLRAPAPLAMDETMAKRLWEVSERMVGLGQQ